MSNIIDFEELVFLTAKKLTQDVDGDACAVYLEDTFDLEVEYNGGGEWEVNGKYYEDDEMEKFFFSDFLKSIDAKKLAEVYNYWSDNSKVEYVGDSLFSIN